KAAEIAAKLGREATSDEKLLDEAAEIEGQIAELQDQVDAKKAEAKDLAIPYVRRPLLTPSQAALKPEQAIKEMNANHAVISNVGGKVVAMEWLQGDDGCDEPSYQTFQAIRDRYSGRYVEIVEVRGQNQVVLAKPMGEWWLGCPARRQYEGLA